jgi:nucleoside-diphosphate-sugar epimerase
MARQADVERLVFASSASIYDQGVGQEAEDVLMDEEYPVDPKAAYATSKLAAERGILPLAGPEFAPVAFRMGTVFGFSPRMRYDLVVNTFVKDALSEGRIHVFYGGSMWRPLIDVKDAARAYVNALACDPQLVRGQVFNLAAGNFRVSELALRAQRTLQRLGVPVELDIDYSYRLVRSYRITSERAQRMLGFSPRVTVEESIEHMVAEIRRHGYTDFSHPRYYNIEWMKVLEEAAQIVSRHGYVLSQPVEAPEPARQPGVVSRISSARTGRAG